ncbi:hypothetical protein FH972_013577 [Carpinus fangiana]|uniref:ATP-dependent 6-phosphofructokinase n=1 Tax=Carpinus fangiana TaxID=176857 RepID=A0A5N6R865_9ROSI|nr:hypothetical protein FH972_013577 [Carpinus fangiana]
MEFAPLNRLTEAATYGAVTTLILLPPIISFTKDWKFAAEQFVRVLPDKVFVHCSERNESTLTLDGVDVMGERLAVEVLEMIQRKPKLSKISFVSHSVGGLVARYAIGRLYRPPKRENVEDSSTNKCEEDSRGTIGGLEAMNFITVATPHLGSRGNKQVPFLFGVPAFEKAANCVIHLIFRRTGRHLFLNDDDEGKPPLLKRMIEDYGDCYFMSALRTFKRRVAYSNVGYDHIVGWRTSSIRRNSDLPKWEDSLNEKYPHVVHEEHCKANDGEQCEPPSIEDKLEVLSSFFGRINIHISREEVVQQLVESLMDLSLSSSSLIPISTPFKSRTFTHYPNLPTFISKSRNFQSKPLTSRQNRPIRAQSSNGTTANDGFVVDDVPHLTDFLPALPVYFKSDEVRACIVTCGGLCPGINTVIREIVCGLNYMYGVEDILGIQGGYRGFYSKNTIKLTPKVVNDIHKRGGTFLRTSRGGHDTSKIVDNIQDRGINQVYIIGGDGTQKGAALISKEVEKRGLQVSVAGIPKTIDNDIAVIDKSFGFDTAVEEAQRAINAAHVEVESVENGVGIVKLMGRYSGFIAMYATLASRDVDCCLIPESPFYLEGRGGLFEFVEERLKENGHMVIVLAEGAGQDYVSQDLHPADEKDASGNRLLLDVGLWLSHKIKEHFTDVKKMAINMKYIDPTYMIRAIPSNASDNVYCTLLAHSAVHGAMAGYTGFTVGPVNSRHAYIPISHVTETQNTVKLTDRMWARLLASTNQPSFLDRGKAIPENVDQELLKA